MQPKRLAKFIKNICEDKKGVEPLILDVSKLSDITRYFVIVSGNSSRHVHALADHIVESTKKKKIRPWHVEKDRNFSWIVVDHGDVITHVFYSETRKYYNLERLWGDAPRVV